MKTFLLLGILLCLGVPLCASESSDDTHTDLFCFNKTEIDIEDDVLIFTCKYDDEQVVEITPDYDLFVNGERVRLNYSQQKLVAKYYNSFFELIESAKEIGLEGAALGVAGAKIGVKAVSGIMKAVFTDYEVDDLEDDLEGESEELEELARELEEMAEDLEARAEDLEDLHYELLDEIEELDDLRWF